MTVATWIVTVLLAVPFAAAGILKATQRPAALAAKGIGWAVDVPPVLVRVIGLCELLGAVGLVAPALSGIAPVLTPVAALGLCAIQACAIVFHVRRRELRGLPVNCVLLCLAAFVAVSRLLGF